MRWPLSAPADHTHPQPHHRHSLSAVASMSAFDTNQMAVIESCPSTSLLVRATAGSGKTTTLAARATALVKAGMSPAGITLLTFSVRSKRDIEAKLQSMLPADGTSVGALPIVQTHHAHALAILRRAGCTATVVEAGTQTKLIRKVLSALPGGAAPPKEQMREAGRAAMAIISRAKGSGQSPPAGSQELAFLNAYNSALRASNAIDFDDMILVAADALRHRVPAAHRRPLHLMLDEAQDTSHSQLELLELFAPPGEVAITAVGDADQTIYSFRGSRPDMLSHLAQRWKCMTLNLPTNYRCGGAIVDVAKALIERSVLRDVPMPLAAARSRACQGSVTVHVSHNRQAELLRLATELRELQQGLAETIPVQPSLPLLCGRYAVLCRTRAQVQEVSAALKEAGVLISRRVQGGRSVSGGGVPSSSLRSAACDVCAVLNLLRNPADDAAFESSLRLLASGCSAAGAPAGATKVVDYLRAVQRMMRAQPGSERIGLLAVAQSAERHSFPSVKESRTTNLQPTNVASLTKTQQATCCDLLATVAEARQRAVEQATPAHLLEWLVRRMRLATHLEKTRKQGEAQKRAFNVRVPGQLNAGDQSSDDSDDSDDDAENDEDDELNHGKRNLDGWPRAGGSVSVGDSISSLYDGGSVHSATRSNFCGLTSHAKPVVAAIGWLVNTASKAVMAERLSPKADEQSRINAIGRLSDALVLASHDNADFADEQDASRVPVITLHQAKGLEWEYVYMPSMLEGSIPILPRGLLPNSLEYCEQIEEERRLCFVGFTRARVKLILSYSEAAEDMNERVATGSRPANLKARPSRFLPKLD